MRIADYLLKAVVTLLASVYWVIFMLVRLAKGTGKAASLVYSKRIIRLWLKKSSALLLGTIAYNIFALGVVQPVLRHLFPPLTPWEHVKGVFGTAQRTTYTQLMPYVGVGLWIAGNAFLFAWMNRDINKAKNDAPRETQA